MTDTDSNPNESLTSDVSTDKWMEILKLLTPESCKNLQSALNQFSYESGYDFSPEISQTLDCGLKTLNKSPDDSELLQPQKSQAMIADSFAESSQANDQFSPSILPSQVAVFNNQVDALKTLTTPVIFTGAPLLMPTELPFDQFTPESIVPPNPTSKDITNGLDTLAAAALANTNSEVRFY